MKVFIYDKRHSKPYIVLKDVREIVETKTKICFTFTDTSTLEVEKKKYKTTIYQN